MKIGMQIAVPPTHCSGRALWTCLFALPMVCGFFIYILSPQSRAFLPARVSGEFPCTENEKIYLQLEALWGKAKSTEQIKRNCVKDDDDAPTGVWKWTATSPETKTKMTFWGLIILKPGMNWPQWQSVFLFVQFLVGFHQVESSLLI